MTRRSMLCLLPSAWVAGYAQIGFAQTKSRGATAKPLPSVGEFVRFADPATENPVVRLTDPRSDSVLPSADRHFVSTRERFLLFSSNRTGVFCPFQVDLRTGALRQLTETTQLQTRSLTLDSRERLLHYIDGAKLQSLNVANKKVETLVEGVTGYSAAPSGSALFAIRGGKLERWAEGKSTVLAEDVAPGDVSTGCLARPGGSGCLFVRETGDSREFWHAGTSKPVLLAKGQISNPFWAADGQTLLFLRDVPKEDAVVSEIHEAPVAADGTPGSERFVSPTSQFACFAPNGDGSVFVGASRGHAQPDIVLLLRASKREMMLCEHRAKQPAMVSPVFSPDSRRVYFESDRQGKTAIYSVNVELLVEPVPVNSN
jgi:oligogalacturonide lyase